MTEIILQNSVDLVAILFTVELSLFIICFICYWKYCVLPLRRRGRMQSEKEDVRDFNHIGNILFL